MLLTVLGWKISLILYRALLHRETVALEWLGNYSINLSAHIWIIWLVPFLAVLTGEERGCPARRRWGILSSFSPFPDIKLIKHWLINQNRSSTESGIINYLNKCVVSCTTVVVFYVTCELWMIQCCKKEDRSQKLVKIKGPLHVSESLYRLVKWWQSGQSISFTQRQNINNTKY